MGWKRHELLKHKNKLTCIEIDAIQRTEHLFTKKNQLN